MAGKADIVDHIAGAGDLTKRQAADTFDAIFEAIANSLAAGERVSIAGFGSFATSHSAERQGRNPSTGEAITIAARTNVKFKAGKELKERVN